LRRKKERGKGNLVKRQDGIPLAAAQLGALSIKEAKRIGRGTGKARPLRSRTVEIVAGTTITATRPEQPPSTQQEPLCLSRL